MGGRLIQLEHHAIFQGIGLGFIAHRVERSRATEAGQKGLTIDFHASPPAFRITLEAMGEARYSQPLVPLVRQIEDLGGGGIGRPRSDMSFTRSFSAWGCAMADCTPTRTKPRAQSSGIQVRPFIAPFT